MTRYADDTFWLHPLTAARARLDLSTYQLAAASGVSRKTIQRIEAWKAYPRRTSTQHHLLCALQRAGMPFKESDQIFRIEDFERARAWRAARRIESCALQEDNF